jgi:dTDP-glucose 4,6-dehydratase
MGITRSRKTPPFSLGVEFPTFYYHVGYESEYVMEEICKYDPEVIANFAGNGEGAASWGIDNWRFYQSNVVDLIKLISQLDYRFIQIGSSEIYGSVNKPVSEDSPLNPGSPYAVSKAAFDQHLLLMHKVKEWKVNIIRPSNCYCPGQQTFRIIPKTLISGLSGRRLPLHGGGVAKKSYLHATDLSRAILSVISHGENGRVYNVGPDEPTSILKVVELCADAIGKPLFDLVDIAPERTGQDSCYWLDSSRMKALGWKQTIAWDEGLAGMVAWVKKYPELLNETSDYRMRA